MHALRLNCRKPAGVCSSSQTLKWLVLTFSFFRVSFSSVSGWTGPFAIKDPSRPRLDTATQAPQVVANHPSLHLQSRLLPWGVDSLTPAVAAAVPCPHIISITKLCASPHISPLPEAVGSQCISITGLQNTFLSGAPSELSRQTTTACYINTGSSSPRAKRLLVCQKRTSLSVFL